MPAEATEPFVAAPIDDQPLPESARNAMRAYLQRTEVRLSTLHRIAVAFISGAGLLLLLPVFFKDEITVLVRVLLDTILDQMVTLQGTNLIGHIALYGLLIYPFILSLAIPLYALYLLLKDVVHFYYTIYSPGFPADLRTPSFALSGVGFSPDESPEAKRRILAYQYHHSSAINFAIPFSPERRRAYFDAIIQATERDILPTSRTYDAVAATGALVDQRTDGVDPATVERFGAAFGLARTLDRSLVEEVATSEISIVRHILYLRRMMLRYMKTLMMFLWTTLVTFIMLPLLQEERMPKFVIMSFAYLIWALLAMKVMRLPIGWIFRHLREVPDDGQIDKQLVILEEQVQPFIRVAIIAAAVAQVLSIVLMVTD
ncbi:MAG: hypothetical protein IPK19_18635 [Chloroflexi bacterium]|nr:hypothetical protein [Chloroflexota bacterium]